MILDTSAIIAILKQEPEAAEFSRAIEAAEACRMSMASFVEAAVVIEFQGRSEGERKYDDMLRDAKVELVSH